MIAKDEMMSLLLDTCPSFIPQWHDFIGECSYAADDLPMYIVLSRLADHLVGMLEDGETTNFPEVFAVVERLHLEGDEYVRVAATVGLLEDIQSSNAYHATNFEHFRQYLGPESERWWNKLIRMWKHGEVLRDD